MTGLCFKNVSFPVVGFPIVVHVFEVVLLLGTTIGDEIEVLNDSWMYLIWTSDHCPYRSNSVSSRWPIAVIPKSLYLMDDQTGLNLTVQAATAEIVASFNRLSSQGIKIKSFPSMGRDVATLSPITEQFFLSC